MFSYIVKRGSPLHMDTDNGVETSGQLHRKHTCSISMHIFENQQDMMILSLERVQFLAHRFALINKV